MSDKTLSLEDRIAKLEKLVSDVGLSKSGVHFKNGEKSITISADSGDTAGIWVEGPDDSIGTIYANKREGAVVGVYGKPDSKGRRGAIDACLYWEPKLGGSVQLVTPDNERFDITPKETVGGGFKLGVRQ